MSKLISYYEENGDRFIEGLKELLRIPSISALPAHQADVRRAADFWLMTSGGWGSIPSN